jgi:Tfp pilus assembly protein PilO
VIRIIEVAGLGLVALDIVVYLAVYRPLGSMIAAEQQHYSVARDRVREQQARVGRLEKFQAALPQAGERLEDFREHRTSPRRRGFSTAAHLVRKVAEAAGVQPPSVTYRLDPAHNDPLQRLGLEINTGGSYPGLLKFAHALETANDFILIREFNLAAGENGMLSLRLVADLYLTP